MQAGASLQAATQRRPIGTLLAAAALARVVASWLRIRGSGSGPHSDIDIDIPFRCAVAAIC